MLWIGIGILVCRMSLPYPYPCPLPAGNWSLGDCNKTRFPTPDFSYMYKYLTLRTLNIRTYPASRRQNGIDIYLKLHLYLEFKKKISSNFSPTQAVFLVIVFLQSADTLFDVESTPEWWSVRSRPAGSDPCS